MNKKCPQCNLVNFLEAETCRRCEFDLTNISVPHTTVENTQLSTFSKILRRAIICFAVCIFSILVFYLSLIFTSAPLAPAENVKINQAISILEAKGFS